MLKKRTANPKGLTIVGLMIATLITVIVIAGIGFVMADSQRGWNAMYNRIYSDVVTDSYVARKTFDSVVRKARSERFLLDDFGNWLEVYYYADPNSIAVDRYARFFSTGGQLNIEYGRLDPRETLSVHTVCENVSGCVFKGAGRTAQMMLTLDNGSQTVIVVSSAVMHN